MVANFQMESNIRNLSYLMGWVVPYGLAKTDRLSLPRSLSAVIAVTIAYGIGISSVFYLWQ